MRRHVTCGGGGRLKTATFQLLPLPSFFHHSYYSRISSTYSLRSTVYSSTFTILCVFISAILLRRVRCRSRSRSNENHQAKRVTVEPAVGTGGAAALRLEIRRSLPDCQIFKGFHSGLKPQITAAYHVLKTCIQAMRR